MEVRVRFAPSPTGSLHLGNALTAVANRRFADAERGVVLLRIDDTDPARVVPGGEASIVEDLEWLGVSWEEGPVRQSEREYRYSAAAARTLASGAVQDDDGSIRLAGTTLLRPDGSATYHLATVVDDLELGVTHIIRGSDHRPNEDIHRRIAHALGAELPPVIHHGLLLGEDGKKLSKRHGHASIADLRDEGIPATAARRYLEELELPRHDVRFDRGRLGRLAIEAIEAMPEAELAAATGAPPELVRALRGARTLVEARSLVVQVLEPAPVTVTADAVPTLARFAELRSALGETLSEQEARALVRELKAVGGDLRAVRLALTGASHGAELWTIVSFLPRGEALARAERAAPSPQAP